MVDPAADESGARWVRVHHLDADSMRSLNEYLQAGGGLQSLLRVKVDKPEHPLEGATPEVAGRYHLLEDGVQFVPYFPLEPGVSYLGSFDLRPLGRAGFAGNLKFALSRPRKLTSSPTEVQHVFPSCGVLPENILRFYLHFSNPMQRGWAEAELSVLGPEGDPAADVLYRAPVELWDRSMRVLTVLLDPGRLKRGVGPNNELGPPLKVGRGYTMVVGTGMTDLYGRRLSSPFYKRFRVADAHREPIETSHWRMVRPVAASREPLMLTFPGPLDRAILSHSLAIASTSHPSIDGQVAIDQCEQRWSFIPGSPWVAGDYEIRIAAGLEDVCGNNLTSAFERVLRSRGTLRQEPPVHTIPFQVI